MRHLVPHALILFATAAWAGGHIAEPTYLTVFALGHLGAPIWSAAVARRATRVRAILVGPGSIIAVHAIALVITWLLAIGDNPEGSWITLMIVVYWSIALAAYVVYCAIAFALVTRFSPRRSS